MQVEMGWDEETVAQKLEMLEAAWGTKAMMTFFSSAASRVGEDAYREGGQPLNLSLSPEGAQARLSGLMADEGWRERYVAGDVSCRAENDRLEIIIASAKKDY
jgi:hypothetical protein